MKHTHNASQEAALRILRQAERDTDPQREDVLILLARAQWHIKNETGLAGGNLTSPVVQSISSSSNQAQYSAAEHGGEYVFTCRTCGSRDLASLWGSGFLDEPTKCNACGAKTYEDPDVTLYFPEYEPDFAAFAPYVEAPAAAEVAA